MTQAQRIPLSRCLANLRADWDLAGTEAAITKLSQAIADPFTVARIAIDWASRTDARTPEGMNHPELRADVTSAATAGWTTRPGLECPEHHNPNWRTDVGMWVCCWQETFEPGRPSPEQPEGANQ